MRDLENSGSDAIGQLVDEQLSRRERSGNPSLGRCQLCGGDWHGAPIDNYDALGGYRIFGCPGAFACKDQREEWENSWAYAVLRREGVVDRQPVRIDDNDLLAAPLPQDMCPLCGGELHDNPSDDTTVFDAGKLPPCPGSLATNEQHRQWLWQCRFRLYCEKILHEQALMRLGFYHGLSTRLDDLLPCGHRFSAYPESTDFLGFNGGC